LRLVFLEEFQGRSFRMVPAALEAEVAKVRVRAVVRFQTAPTELKAEEVEALVPIAMGQMPPTPVSSLTDPMVQGAEAAEVLARIAMDPMLPTLVSSLTDPMVQEAEAVEVRVPTAIPVLPGATPIVIRVLQGVTRTAIREL
jgi:hypothetical protein